LAYSVPAKLSATLLTGSRLVAALVVDSPL